MIESAAAIQTSKLARSFGEMAAVRALDLSVRRGSMFGLVGPDGAGKSTTIRMLCGILSPTGGTGSVLGFDLATEAEKIKGEIGYLSQQFTLYGDLTVDENIEFFAQLHDVDHFKQRRDELLEFTRLTPFRKRLAQALSGGMKKKLALACTLIHTPKIIFLDEPSTGVDPVSRGEFWNILSDILEQGVTVFMTTPYLDEAERCHDIGLMYRGELFMTGSPEQIKAALPGRIYELASQNAAAAYHCLRRRWSSTHLVLAGDRVRLWTTHDESDVLQATASLEQEGLGPVSAKQVEPTLEDAFVALLGTESAQGGAK